MSRIRREIEILKTCCRYVTIERLKMEKIDKNQKIRVMRLLGRMNVCGPARHVVNLVKAMPDLGYETRFLTGAPETSEGSMLAWAEAQGVIPAIVNHLDRPVVPLADFAAFHQIVREIRAFRPHVMHTHTTKAGCLGRLAAVVCGVPAIFHTYHGFIFSGYFSRPVSQIVVAIERFLACFTDRLITLTPGLGVELASRLKLSNNRKVEAVPLGLDLAKNLALPRKSTGWRRSIGLRADDFIIGIVGRVVPVKNHALLLQTFARLVKLQANLQLAVVGGGELENELRQMALNLEIADRVHFCGVTFNIEEVYADLDLLVLSSRNEGTPVVLIEAIASGCPVAATDVGGVAEILENGRNGFILPVDPEGFARGLEAAVRTCRSQGVSYSDAFRNSWAEKYSIGGLAGRLDAIYRKTLRFRGFDV